MRYRRNREPLPLTDLREWAREMYADAYEAEYASEDYVEGYMAGMAFVINLAGEVELEGLSEVESLEVLREGLRYAGTAHGPTQYRTGFSDAMLDAEAEAARQEGYRRNRSGAVTAAKVGLKEARARKRSAQELVRQRVNEVRKKLLDRESRARAVRRQYEHVGRMLRARRSRLGDLDVGKALPEAEAEVERAEAQLERVRREYELMHPEAAKGARRGGKRAQELRSDRVDQTARHLEDNFDQQLFRQLAYTQRVARGSNKGKLWADIAPDRARELFEEWIEENTGEYENAKAEAFERGIAEAILEMQEDDVPVTRTRRGPRKARREAPRLLASGAEDDDIPFN